jgi:hypothetical protein
MRDVSIAHRRLTAGVYVFWTLLNALALTAAVALFVQGVMEGWPLAGLILVGAGIAVATGSLWAHVLVILSLRGKKESRRSSDEEGISDSPSSDPDVDRSYRPQD